MFSQTAHTSLAPQPVQDGMDSQSSSLVERVKSQFRRSAEPIVPCRLRPFVYQPDALADYLVAEQERLQRSLASFERGLVGVFWGLERLHHFGQVLLGEPLADGVSGALPHVGLGALSSMLAWRTHAHTLSARLAAVIIAPMFTSVLLRKAHSQPVLPKHVHEGLEASWLSQSLQASLSRIGEEGAGLWGRVDGLLGRVRY